MGRISEIFPVGACNAQQCQYSVSYFFLDGSCRGRGGGNFHVTKCFAFLCILVEAETEATCYKDTFMAWVITMMMPTVILSLNLLWKRLLFTLGYDNHKGQNKSNTYYVLKYFILWNSTTQQLAEELHLCKSVACRAFLPFLNSSPCPP